MREKPLSQCPYTVVDLPLAFTILSLSLAGQVQMIHFCCYLPLKIEKTWFEGEAENCTQNFMKKMNTTDGRRRT